MQKAVQKRKAAPAATGTAELSGYALYKPIYTKNGDVSSVKVNRNLIF